MLDESQEGLSGEVIDVVRLMCIKDVLRSIRAHVIAVWQHNPSLRCIKSKYSDMTLRILNYTQDSY